MKKVYTFSGRILGLAAISAFAAISQADPITIRIDGQLVQFTDAKPHMMGDQIMVPIRDVIEQAGGDVGWNSVDKTVTAQKGDTNLEIQVPTEEATVNGMEESIDGPVHIQDGRTMVPIRFLADSLGADIQYDGDLNVVNVLMTDSTPTVSTSTNDNPTPPSPEMMWEQPTGSAIKAELDDQLSSLNSYVGQPFTATVITDGTSDFYGFSDGATLRGHVSFVQPMRDGVPGILGITYDELVLKDGRKIAISATPIDADADITTGEDGRWAATSSALTKQDMKYVGVNYSDSGMLVPLVSHGNSVSMDDVDQAVPDRGLPNEVTLNTGTLLGVRFDRDSIIDANPL
ncbi:MAG: copper amine oxidase N-terminal domain-containing protein [Armatimonadetes bacterium]|nr:copper amine oxidase N-terminal domain-containing protein [Armatimonadota bacterium]